MVKKGPPQKRRKQIYGVPVRGLACEYCGLPAANREHVIPRSVARNYEARKVAVEHPIPTEWRRVVPACFNCNIRKGARRLVPPSWADKVPAMNEFFGGTPWRVWNGDPSEPAYAEAWTR